MSEPTDFLVIGAGIAGASAGYFLAAHGRVTLLEMESAPGYHSTGRSATLFSEYYGNPVVRALTAESRLFYEAPPDGFAEHALLHPRGVVALCAPGTEDAFGKALADGRTVRVPVHEIGPDDVLRLCPVIRPGSFTRAMLKPAAMDVDGAAVHQGFLRGIRAAGGRIVSRAGVRALDRRGGLWRAVTADAEFHAPVVVDAAGAWADEIAALAGAPRVDMTPMRRTAFVVDAPEATAPGDWPMVADVAETFYFRPESGRLLVSPVDATPVPPGDARPDDLDIALGAQRVEQATTLTIRRILHAWAGLRSTVADDVPVVGAAPGVPGFYWLAALGGYGFQVAPAAGRLLAAQVAGGTESSPNPDIQASAVSPGRFSGRRSETPPRTPAGGK